MQDKRTERERGDRVLVVEGDRSFGERGDRVLVAGGDSASQTLRERGWRREGAIDSPQS